MKCHCFTTGLFLVPEFGITHEKKFDCDSPNVKFVKEGRCFLYISTLGATSVTDCTDCKSLGQQILDLGSQGSSAVP